MYTNKPNSLQILNNETLKKIYGGWKIMDESGSLFGLHHYELEYLKSWGYSVCTTSSGYEIYEFRPENYNFCQMNIENTMFISFLNGLKDIKKFISKLEKD